MAHIKLSIIANLHGTIKQITKLTLSDLKQRRMNHAPILLGVPTAETNTKLTPQIVYFGNTTSIKNGIAKNMLNFAKIERSQFVQ